MNRATRRAAAHAKRQPLPPLRPLDPAAALRVLSLHGEPDQPTATGIMIILRNAFDAITHGTTDGDQFNALAAAMNVGMIRAEGIDPLLEDVMKRGVEAVRQCGAIHDRHHRFGLTGPGRIDLLEALDAYEQILRLSTPAQMQTAVDESRRRMREQMREAA